MPPAVPIGVLPPPILARGFTPAVREGFQRLLLEEVQSVEQVAHLGVLSLFGRVGGGKSATTLDVMKKSAGPGVDDPGQDQADHVEGKEQPQCADG